MRRAFVCALGTLLSSPCWASDGSAAAAGGLCAPKETTYFQCSAGKGRSINLCGPGEGAVQYRFGRNGAVELAFPADAKDGARSLRYAHYFRAQTDRHFRGFRADDTTTDDHNVCCGDARDAA